VEGGSATRPSNNQLERTSGFVRGRRAVGFGGGAAQLARYTS